MRPSCKECWWEEQPPCRRREQLDIAAGTAIRFESGPRGRKKHPTVPVGVFTSGERFLGASSRLEPGVARAQCLSSVMRDRVAMGERDSVEGMLED